MEGGERIMEMGTEIRVIQVETEPRWIGPIEPAETPVGPALEDVQAD